MRCINYSQKSLHGALFGELNSTAIIKNSPISKMFYYTRKKPQYSEIDQEIS